MSTWPRGRLRDDAQDEQPGHEQGEGQRDRQKSRGRRLLVGLVGAMMVMMIMMVMVVRSQVHTVASVIAQIDPAYHRVEPIESELRGITAVARILRP